MCGACEHVRRMRWMAIFLLAGCGPSDVSFSAPGALGGAAGKGSFRFGAASAATQIEDMNPTTDWWIFTAPTSMGGLGHDTFVGDASMGYTKALDDVALLTQTHLDSYRFSIEWARVEPTRGVYNQAALDHYSAVLDALRAAGVRPVVTLHHFSNPLWVDDPRDPMCTGGPSDTNLCGFGDPVGGPQIAQSFADFATLVGQRFGDRVDDWGTVNEPVNYLLTGYGVGQFPPGKSYIISDIVGKFMPVARGYLAMHAAGYKALKAADTVDADGDGVTSSVGLSLSVAEWVPAANNAVSTAPSDVAARDRLVYVFHHLFIDSLENGTFDADLDGTAEESHPDWQGTLDWLGAQYYFRAGVTGDRGLLPVVDLTPCFGAFDFGSCIPPTDPSFCVPIMDYEYYPPGIYNVLKDFSARWPALPLVVTEGGISTTVGARRAENVVRTLEQIARARDEGVDVRGYFHWSLFDNFEWALGFGPRFGLYTVDYNTYARTPTDGAMVYGDIANARKLTAAQRNRYGGLGPMTAEPGVPVNAGFCTKDVLGQ
jgi:beta-glucosidase